MFMGGMAVPENINLCLWEAWPYPRTLIYVYGRSGRTREHKVMFMRLRGSRSVNRHDME
jgi:hypothetical protein